MNKQNKELDQFFTNPVVAASCVANVAQYVSMDMAVLEPSAGDGAFFFELAKRYPNVVGCDIDPRFNAVIKQDYLTSTFTPDAVIGNPPFGKRSALAIQFFNHAAKTAQVIAFIVPIQFRKWSVQSKLDKRFALVSDELLPEDSFLVDGKPYKVRCCFQVWLLDCDKNLDMRLKNAPATAHPDFTMHQYNNTQAALKVFDQEFDFAVPRQGYQDYTRKEVFVDKCERSIQWVLIKAHSEQALETLLNIDYAELAKRNTTTPGFGKADIVDAYIGASNE